jgi:hypothetical protein
VWDQRYRLGAHLDLVVVVVQPHRLGARRDLVGVAVRLLVALRGYRVVVW